jgi:predicted component of type VI protein secretion system
VRSNYTPEELVALAEISKLMAGEIGRSTQIVTACLNHLVTCESPDHRAKIAAQAGRAVSAILTYLRYCAWIEAEVTQTRAISDPLAVLAEVTAQQAEVAEIFKAQQEERLKDKQAMPAVESAAPAAPEQPQVAAEAPQVPVVAAPGASIDKAAAAMDKLATAPSTKTVN